MSYGNDHDHRGQYAEDRHDHDYDYAGKHHRHHDLAEETGGVREDLGRAEARISELEERVNALAAALTQALASDTPGGAR